MRDALHSSRARGRRAPTHLTPLRSERERVLRASHNLGHVTPSYLARAGVHVHAGVAFTLAVGATTSRGSAMIIELFRAASRFITHAVFFAGLACEPRALQFKTVA